ncbi:MAG: DUF4118 domain-containing protein [Pseudomonadota bacterium]|nr:DUF4118 domain-containing protein [Pseudomonadota bacterium]
MEQKRPNPDELLQRIQEEKRLETRGKLKIYFGAAPGVGKTYNMLHDALQEQADGLDVVVGVVESHNRKEIDALLKDLKIIPKQTLEYHGKKLIEFDLDAALKRRPALILMDEMAHTNAPGTHHKKRWRDIKELLDRGINVYTTLNVQHIESLNDDVAQIIQAPIKETVPDSMIELANTIVLVDLPPEELLKRLHEGKVYFPAQATIAADHFFRKGNLTALRELALRTTANRVGVQVLHYRHGQGITEIWPTRERIMVCVGHGPEAPKLIRTAKRMATYEKAEWVAVYIDTPHVKSSENKRNKAIENLRFAEKLGAESRILTGENIVKELIRFAREQNITQIVTWKHSSSRWRNILSRNIADEILRDSGAIDAYITTGKIDNTKPYKPERSKKTANWWAYGVSLATVSLATAIGYLIYPYVKPSNLIMIYLLGVTLVSRLGQMGPSILATVLSVIAFDFFFMHPSISFGVTDIENLITLLVMLIVAQIISQLAIRTRRLAESARQSEKQTSALYTLTRQLSGSRGIPKLLQIGVGYIASVFDSEVIALLPENNHLVIKARDRTHQILNEKEQGVAEWVFELGQMAGLGTDSLSFSDALYLPMLGSHNVIGVLRIRPTHPEYLVSPDQIHLLENCAHQIALALEVDQLHDKSLLENK